MMRMQAYFPIIMPPRKKPVVPAQKPRLNLTISPLLRQRMTAAESAAFGGVQPNWSSIFEVAASGYLDTLDALSAAATAGNKEQAALAALRLVKKLGLAEMTSEIESLFD